MSNEEQKYIFINGVCRPMTQEEEAEMVALAASAQQPVPASITNAQLRLQLLAMDKLDLIDQAIQNNTGEQAKKIEIEWEYAVVVAGSSDLFKFVVAELALSEQEEREFLIAAVEL